MVILKSEQKSFEGDLKVRLCGKRLYPTETVKYMRVKTDANLSCQCQVDASPKIIRSIYISIFESHLSCCSLVWAQNFRYIQRIVILQKRLLESLIFDTGVFILIPYLYKSLI